MSIQVIRAMALDDGSNTRTVYIVIGALVSIGLVLVVLALWLIRQTRPERELLAPLERMADRSWSTQDPSERRRLLDEVRPVGARPLRPFAADSTSTSVPLTSAIDAEVDDSAVDIDIDIDERNGIEDLDIDDLDIVDIDVDGSDATAASQKSLGGASVAEELQDLSGEGPAADLEVEEDSTLIEVDRAVDEHEKSHPDEPLESSDIDVEV